MDDGVMGNDDLSTYCHFDIRRKEDGEIFSA